MKIYTLTATRGDRPEVSFFDEYIERQTLKPAKSIVVDYPPKSDKKDLTERVRHGIEKIREIAQPSDIVAIIEDDDYYPANYLFYVYHQFTIHKDLQAFGWEETFYYHVKKGLLKMSHKEHSSLFCTSFRLSALDGFEWPNGDEVFLDVKLWKFLRSKKVKLQKANEGLQPIGIKHGIGLTGGKGHIWNTYTHDPNNAWLLDRIGKDIERYEKLL